MHDSRAVTLLLCVLGLYALFLSWSLLQERINTKPYDFVGSDPVFFKAPLVVNIVQALFASLVGLAYSLIAHRKSPFVIFSSNDGKHVSPSTYLRYFVVIAITSSVSSPLGYQSLKHVDYLVYLLSKSCKLIPVMLVHFALYKTRFPVYKLVVAGMVTGGVIVFTLAKSGGKSKASINDGNTLLGLAQLVGSMMMDGFTNSTQDQLFRLPNQKHKLTGAALMCILNCFVATLTLVYLVLVKYEAEGLYTVRFVQQYPNALLDILAFSLFGAVGQVFVFIILEKFDSLILVTATVTRKMISMILSVVLFGHHLVPLQWLGVGMVFGGIGYESYVKMAPKPKAKQN